ncbi:uncharacterized protein LOC135927646 isoform X3 [Gordionus sp. m RMFG-2023]|uniref:uncharacterized protein LOC135927646 isoform X3 n=1 Tax=Gordionus sp. m RMFG-2023 TaxID=3053472 RepID=UPI0031FBAB09
MISSHTFNKVVFEFPDIKATAFCLNLKSSIAILSGPQSISLIDVNQLTASTALIKQYHCQEKWDINTILCMGDATLTTFVKTCDHIAILYRITEDLQLKEIAQIQRHSRIISDVDKCDLDPNLFITSSMDNYCHIWDIRCLSGNFNKPVNTLNSITPASQCKWSKHDFNVIASAHETDIHIWDIRKPKCPLHFIPAHSSAINSLDWYCPNSHSQNQNGDDQHLLVSAGQDAKLKTWRPVASSCSWTTSGSYNLTVPARKARFVNGWNRGLMTIPVNNFSHSSLNVNAKFSNNHLSLWDLGQNNKPHNGDEIGSKGYRQSYPKNSRKTKFKHSLHNNKFNWEDDDDSFFYLSLDKYNHLTSLFNYPIPSIQQPIHRFVGSRDCIIDFNFRIIDRKISATSQALRTISEEKNEESDLIFDSSLVTHELLAWGRDRCLRIWSLMPQLAEFFSQGQISNVDKSAVTVNSDHQSSVEEVLVMENQFHQKMKNNTKNVYPENIPLLTPTQLLSKDRTKWRQFGSDLKVKSGDTFEPDGYDANDFDQESNFNGPFISKFTEVPSNDKTLHYGKDVEDRYSTRNRIDSNLFQRPDNRVSDKRVQTLDVKKSNEIESIKLLTKTHSLDQSLFIFRILAPNTVDSETRTNQQKSHCSFKIKVVFPKLKKVTPLSESNFKLRVLPQFYIALEDDMDIKKFDLPKISRALSSHAENSIRRGLPCLAPCLRLAHKILSNQFTDTNFNFFPFKVVDNNNIKAANQSHIQRESSLLKNEGLHLNNDSTEQNFSHQFDERNDKKEHNNENNFDCSYQTSPAYEERNDKKFNYPDSIPFPRTCGASFSGSNFLVCFFRHNTSSTLSVSNPSLDIIGNDNNKLIPRAVSVWHSFNKNSGESYDNTYDNQNLESKDEKSDRAVNNMVVIYRLEDSLVSNSTDSLNVSEYLSILFTDRLLNADGVDACNANDSVIINTKRLSNSNANIQTNKMIRKFWMLLYLNAFYKTHDYQSLLILLEKWLLPYLAQIKDVRNMARMVIFLITHVFNTNYHNQDENKVTNNQTPCYGLIENQNISFIRPCSWENLTKDHIIVQKNYPVELETDSDKNAAPQSHNVIPFVSSSKPLMITSLSDTLTYDLPANNKHLHSQILPICPVIQTFNMSIVASNVFVGTLFVRFVDYR